MSQRSPSLDFAPRDDDAEEVYEYPSCWFRIRVDAKRAAQDGEKSINIDIDYGVPLLYMFDEQFENIKQSLRQDVKDFLHSNADMETLPDFIEKRTIAILPEGLIADCIDGYIKTVPSRFLRHLANGQDPRLDLKRFLEMPEGGQVVLCVNNQSVSTLNTITGDDILNELCLQIESKDAWRALGRNVDKGRLNTLGRPSDIPVSALN